MKIVPKYTEEDLNKITNWEFHDLWFNKALTDRQMAKLFNVDVSKIKKKRKEFGLNWFNSAMMFLAGGDRFKGKGNNRYGCS
mgnify:CR=1 FL=1